MSEFAVKMGRLGGVHREVHVYSGSVPGQRAHAGTLVFREESAQRFIQLLVDAGCDRVSDVGLFAPVEGERNG